MMATPAALPRTAIAVTTRQDAARRIRISACSSTANTEVQSSTIRLTGHMNGNLVA